jgi:hypothetical protein
MPEAAGSEARVDITEETGESFFARCTISALRPQRRHTIHYLLELGVPCSDLLRGH